MLINLFQNSLEHLISFDPNMANTPPIEEQEIEKNMTIVSVK
ncbi:hypothetical protein RINTHM_12020 [Richelia intracellularis HM01]|nr:hypothetical protein RINTHM_12020 [Richelia intracellularis HM01]